MRHRPIHRLSAALLLALAAGAQAQVQHAHVHGQAFADVAIDGGSVEIQLRATAHDLVGFERAAANPEEEARVLAARKAVLDHAALWQFSIAAACVAEAPVLEVPDAKAHDHDHADDHGHDHDHDHDHSHDHDHEHDEGHQHADWTARYRFRCSNPAALRSIDTGLFAQFPSLQSVTVQLIDADGARGETLTPEARRLNLAP
jgi:hypothetical protein